MSIKLNNTINNFANNSGVRNFATKLCSPSNLLPVIILEGAVLTGRTDQARKRGGKVEARERVMEEGITSVLWLWGIKVFNKGFDLLINQVGSLKNKTGMKDFNFDTGKDAFRQPFAHATKGLSEKSKKLVATLKFTKIVASAGLVVGLTGFLLPKINQAITRKVASKEAQKETKLSIEPGVSLDMHSKNSMTGNKANHNSAYRRSPQKTMDITTFLTMARGAEGDPKKDNSTKFKGGGFFEVAAHQLENDNITQLLTFDTGLFTGRAVNARNKYEKREILFRDLASSFFYVAATPLIYAGLLLVDPLKGKNTQVAANIANDLNENITAKFNGRKSMHTQEFKTKIQGTNLVDKKIIKEAEELFNDEKNAKTGKPLTVEQMHTFIEQKVDDKKLAQSLKQKAEKLSELQPKLNDKKILTRLQVENIFNDGMLNDPKVINKLINDSTEGKAQDPLKFISQKKVDNYRKHIKNYVESIVEKAEKENVTHISTDFLQKLKSRNMTTKLGYWGAGIAVSAYCLATAIPKIQYSLTRKATGKDIFPGVAEYDS